MPQGRQLAAIMFTDIVGYTAMMQADEQKTVAVIKHYNSTLEKLVTAYDGQVLNYYADGSLCIFLAIFGCLSEKLKVDNHIIPYKKCTHEKTA
jgi:adenylate cyclase